MLEEGSTETGTGFFRKSSTTPFDRSLLLLEPLPNSLEDRKLAVSVTCSFLEVADTQGHVHLGEVTKEATIT